MLCVCHSFGASSRVNEPPNLKIDINNTTRTWMTFRNNDANTRQHTNTNGCPMKTTVFALRTWRFLFISTYRHNRIAENSSFIIKPIVLLNELISTARTQYKRPRTDPFRECETTQSVHTLYYRHNPFNDTRAILPTAAGLVVRRP